LRVCRQGPTRMLAQLKARGEGVVEVGDGADEIVGMGLWTSRATALAKVQKRPLALPVENCWLWFSWSRSAWQLVHLHCWSLSMGTSWT